MRRLTIWSLAALLGLAITILGFVALSCAGISFGGTALAAEVEIAEGASGAYAVPAGKLVLGVSLQEKSGEKNAGIGANVSLEKAIETAKKYFNVPDEFDKFTSNYNESGGEGYWHLRWYASPEGDVNGSLTVDVSAETGEVRSMYKYTYKKTGDRFKGLPKYEREEARKIAEDLVQKLQPQKFAQTRLSEDESPPVRITLGDRGPIRYYFRYERLVNGIPFKENNISVSVNGDTGEVESFHLNWDEELEFPGAKNIISQEEAEEIFMEEGGPQLIYFAPRRYGEEDVEIKLVYRTVDMFIDALTGEVLEEPYPPYDYEKRMAAGGDEGYASAAGAPQLTPVEQEAVDELKGLMSREKALAIAEKTAGIKGDNKEYKLERSRLDREYRFPELKIWSFYWRKDSDKKSDREDREGSIRVGINAKTGELISYNKYEYGPEQDKKWGRYSEEKARKIAEDYIKKLQPEKWEQVVFEESRPEPYYPEPVRAGEKKPEPRYYNFSYTRQVNDVPFFDNGFSIRVDSAAGEVTSYNMNWWDAEFPEPEGIMTRQRAGEKFLAQEGLILEYLRRGLPRPYIADREDEKQGVRLVYHKGERAVHLMDAVTGQELDYRGEPVEEKEEVVFTDIAGHPAEDDIKLLARAGIITGMNGKFRPDDAIKEAELVKILVEASGYPAMEYVKKLEALGKAETDKKEPWYKKYYQAAINAGIMDKDAEPQPDVEITRARLARFLVNAEGMSRAAKLSEIYKVPAKDAGKVAAADRGYVALALGLDLLETDNGFFKPGEKVTRAQAVEIIVDILQREEGNN